ncbi:oxoglutarate iron-dependent oxygenase [Diplodia corticola]|uniref:Oxoglutarate iron-dependent oxygenase n=1 Tax=Diplodia corticola TaxID=236234 RepID=A0A1J9RV87_9PEZI|nr:oxoglutarate iron-dependent oxygenase [Diplodia corticola]OJD32311.1 oxoglutarate iron-dependent oxygenase [Diplodia corticola]
MSVRELMGLAAGEWNYAGLKQDADQMQASSNPPRRRSSQKGQHQQDHRLALSPLPSAPLQSPTAPTPPSSVPSSWTSVSASRDPSGSELSSAEDVSDWSEAEKRSPKKRKVDAPIARPQRTRKPSLKVLENTTTEANKRTRRRSSTIVLKLDGKKLQELVTRPSSGEPTSPSLPTASAPEPIRTQEAQGPLTSLPSSPKSEAQLRDAPSPTLVVTKCETFTPTDGAMDVDPTSQVSEKTPTKLSRKRRWPKETDSLIGPATESQTEENGRQAAPDPIPQDLEPLAHVSRQLMHLSGCPIDAKPPPVGQPEVWADGRQALCESLPYFRGYQSAGYCADGLAYSFMFDKEGSCRDYMDSEVVIARSGGGLTKDHVTGKMARHVDQSETKQVESVRNSIHQYNPVAILAGEGNSQCPSRVPRVYTVLDWFKPTHIWAEKFNGMVNIRYRFEKLRLDKQSWWASSTGPEPTRVGEQAPPHVHTCLQCEKKSEQVYLQGWMCLHPDCPRFWKLESGHEPQEAGLLYDPRFLKQKTDWPHASAPQPLRPDHLTLGPTPMLGDDVSWAAAKGLVCPQCGRCNSREAWEGWYCGNPDCDFSYRLPHANIPANALHDPYRPISYGYTISKDKNPGNLALRMELVHNYRINYFTIPGVDGFIAHFIANKAINEEAGGPDDMWTELQASDLGLRRRPLATTSLKGQTLTQHFLMNYGMPYKFAVATASQPFSSAPRPITATRSRLNWAARHCVGADVHSREAEFNELLALGYFEKQKISYHDDGEKGLGPTIATLSIGAPATMSIRMKEKHHFGVTEKKGTTDTRTYVDIPPIQGCNKFEERLSAHAQLEQLKREGDAAAYRERLKALPAELELKKKGKAKELLEMHLRHGDIVVMHGAKMQQYYEHKVEPVGKLRFALTCRYIRPDSLEPKDRPEYEVGPDMGEYDGARLPAVSV